ncbi:MAG: hypothetical protein ACPGJS_11750 [Flammeovirgaceae bacterium]
MENPILKILFGLVIMLMFSILIAADDAWFLIIGVGGGFWLFHWGLKSLIRQEKAFQNYAIQVVMELPDDQKYQLHFDRKAWQLHAEQVIKQAKFIPLVITGTTFITMVIGSEIAIFSSSISPSAILIMIPVILPVSYAVWKYQHFHAQAKLNAYQADIPPQIIISRKGIIVNQSFIFILGTHRLLSNFADQQKDDLHLLNIITSSSQGNKTVKFSYFFPFPQEKNAIAVLQDHFGVAD